MSDYYIIPEIENAVIVFVSHPSLVEDSPDYSTSVCRQLTMIGAMGTVTPYIYYEPTDMDEEIHEWLADFESQFAFAAQMPGTLAERARFAFRRIYSRNATKKAMLVTSPWNELTPAEIEAAFVELETCDAVLKADGKHLLVGMKGFRPALLDDDADSPEALVSCVEQRAEGTLQFKKL